MTQSNPQPVVHNKRHSTHLPVLTLARGPKLRCAALDVLRAVLRRCMQKQIKPADGIFNKVDQVPTPFRLSQCIGVTGRLSS